MTMSFALANQNMNRRKRNRICKLTMDKEIEISNEKNKIKRFSFIINRYNYICNIFKNKKT